MKPSAGTTACLSPHFLLDKMVDRRLRRERLKPLWELSGQEGTRAEGDDRPNNSVECSSQVPCSSALALLAFCGPTIRAAGRRERQRSSRMTIDRARGQGAMADGRWVRTACFILQWSGAFSMKERIQKGGMGRRVAENVHWKLRV